MNTIIDWVNMCAAALTVAVNLMSARHTCGTIRILRLARAAIAAVFAALFWLHVIGRGDTDTLEDFSLLLLLAWVVWIVPTFMAPEPPPPDPDRIANAVIAELREHFPR